MKRNLGIVMGVVLASFSLTACTIGNANVTSAKDDDNTVAQVAESKTDVNTVDDTNAGTDTDDKINTDANDKDSDNTTGENDAASKEDEFKDKIIAESGCEKDDIKAFILDDFDGDGSEEAFAITGDDIDEDFGCVPNSFAWFVSDSKCQKICQGNGMGLGKEIRTMKVGDINYVMIDDLYVSEGYSFVYYVSGGSISEAEFSHIGSVWQDEGNPSFFTITHPAYDMMLDNTIGGVPIGHTWKKYYFFYDPEDQKIHEYAGTSIDDKTLEYWVGRDIIGELVPAGDKINDVFMRGNGMIVVNYEHLEDEGSISYYHYIYNLNLRSFVDDMGLETNEEPLPGVYLNCLLPEMASYPEVPGPDGNVWYGE